MNPQRHMEMESQGEEAKGRGGRRWCPASMSHHLPLAREGCLVPAPALGLRAFFLAVETLLAPAQGKPEVLALVCLEAAPSSGRGNWWINTPASLPRGMEDSRHGSHLPAFPGDGAPLVGA